MSLNFTEICHLYNKLIKMDRKAFLAQLGIGSSAIFAAACMQSCSKSDSSQPGQVTPGGSVDFSLDLSDPANAVLKTPGGYLIYKGIIVALAKNGNYLAVSSACPHQGVNVQYVSNQDQFYCSAHGSYFASTGNYISGPANGRSLTQFKTTLTGNSLRVYA
jgi:cytochrome b6-f complex iron-sulfur subunit